MKIILHGNPQGSNGETLLLLECVNDLDTNISNAIGIKPKIFAYESSILIIGKDTQDLIFNLDRIYGYILP
jgi:hypothetical protein